MKIHLLKYLLLLALVFSRLTGVLAFQEIREGHQPSNSNEKHYEAYFHLKHTVLQRIAGNVQGPSLFFEQIEDTEEDDELKELSYDLIDVVKQQHSFHFYFSNVKEHTEGQGPQTHALGLKDQHALFIVFRFLRI